MVDAAAKPEQPVLNFQGRWGWKLVPHSQAEVLAQSTGTADGGANEGGPLSLQSLWKLSFLEVYMNSCGNHGKDSPGSSAPPVFITLPKPQAAFSPNWIPPAHRCRLGQHHSFSWNSDLSSKTSTGMHMPSLSNAKGNWCLCYVSIWRPPMSQDIFVLCPKHSRAWRSCPESQTQQQQSWGGDTGVLPQRTWGWPTLLIPKPLLGCRGWGLGRALGYLCKSSPVGPVTVCLTEISFDLGLRAPD